MSLYIFKHNTLGDTTGEGITETDTIATSTKVNPDSIDGAIDEAIKAETEKLYDEACSIVSSSGILSWTFSRYPGIFQHWDQDAICCYDGDQDDFFDALHVSLC